MVKVRSPPDRVTAPVYVCVPVVLTLAPRFDVPDTDRFVTPVMAPSTSALPVIARPLLPPEIVDCVLMIEPVKLVLASKATASAYV